MPYLIGVHLSLIEKVRNISLDDVVILNVDTNTLETPFDDLQSLPNDIISALKSRLKKVSMTTGDGVARAFLKAQAAFFGSYRNALKIEPEEPITFCEETFVSHRSATMRQFLQNAIQLQLFKQVLCVECQKTMLFSFSLLKFIDGRLDLLNSGEGFSDVFEEEINLGEYAERKWGHFKYREDQGKSCYEDRLQICKCPELAFEAKDHAKMGIREVKIRLKQKDISENGCSTMPEESTSRTAPSPLAEKRDAKLRDERRPITVHFGQVRPPRPQVVRRPKGNVAMDGRRTSVSSPEHLAKPTRHYTVFLLEDSSGDELPQEDGPVSAFSDSFLFSAPFEWPQPYRALKESDSGDGEEGISPERFQDDHQIDPITPESPADISLLEDIFTGLEVTSQPQPLSQARSLEDLRISKEEEDQQCSFDYQRMDLGFAEKSWTTPGMKLSHPYKQFWGLGHDDMALSTKYSPKSPERPLRNVPPVPRRPQSRDVILDLPEKEVGNSPAAQGNITIPRPQGRKTPELGIVPPPPPPRLSNQQAPPEAAPCLAGPGNLASELLQETFAARNVSVDRQPASFAPHQVQLSSAAITEGELLQPVKVNAEGTSGDSDSLLALLDPLKSGEAQDARFPSGSRSQLSSSSPSPAGSFPSTGEDLMPSTSAPFRQLLGYPPSVTPFGQPSLNPFVQTMPTPLPLTLVRPPGGPFAPSLGHAYSSSYITSNSSFFQPQRPPLNPLTLSMPNLFAKSPSAPPLAQPPSQSGVLQPTQPSGPSKIQTLPLTHAAVKTRLAVRPSNLPLLPPKTKVGEPALCSSKTQLAKDPFEDLLNKTKQEVSIMPGKVEQLRRQWETFE
ncbi:DENN domain-containing protein 1A [Ophiophagus hannah]|uniref:DENN domain-containing protein 1A n=1 Tax=Ophiophagus hannah TaxID=8665 RepID=V8NI03_OPHHA|nr:DENN domain-containing protein 1A [Ophiophagus hannah]